MTATSWREAITRFFARASQPPSSPTTSLPYQTVSVPLQPPPLPEPNAWMRLSSAHKFLAFRVGVVIQHTAGAPDLLPGQASQIARAAIHRRAEEISRRYRLTQADWLYTELVVELAEGRPASNGVVARAACIVVDADPADVEIVRRYEQAQRIREETSWQDVVRDYRMRSYMPLLTDPVRAAAWWLASTEDADRIAKLPEIAQRFAQMSDALASTAAIATESAQQSSDSLGSVIDDLLKKTDPAEAEFLCGQLARVCSDYGYEDLAARIRQLNGHASVPEGHEPVSQGVEV